MTYELFHSKNNMRSLKKGNSKEQLIKFCENNGITTFEIFKASFGFHSTTQDEYLVCWKDEKDNSYFANRSKNEPKLLEKRIY